MKKVYLLLPLAAFCIGMASAGCSAKPQPIPYRFCL